MFHVMLDLETLSLEPKAVVFQIGYAVFDIKSGEVITSDVLHLDILPQIMRGRIVDPETQQWWMTQEKGAWSRWPNDVKTVSSALGDINALFDEGRAISHVWANSPSFDCVILRSLAADFDTKLAWDFRQEMDLRTLKSMNSIARLDPAEPFTTTHNALQDCLDQVEKVMFYWNNIIGEEPTPG